MRTLPKITPLVLKRRAEAFDNPDWLFELKYFRAVAGRVREPAELARGLRKTRQR